jgi:myo-inositol-1(or 4)-monophosphatase
MNIEKAEKLITYIIASGKRIVTESGQIKDIGIKKKYLTEEDITIERGIKEIATEISKDATFYAEEEHGAFIENESVWVCDPISGTKLFIQGLPNYAIVASHLNKGTVDFAVVYNPSSGDLYTADKENGAFLNGNHLTAIPGNEKRIIFAPFSTKGTDTVRQILERSFKVFPSQGSFALNYCLVATGKFAGVVSITKDSFPEFAGCFIANQAGYIATNINGSKTLLPTDRLFVCGATNHAELLEILKLTTIK